MHSGEGRVKYKLGLLCVYGEEGERSCLTMISHVNRKCHVRGQDSGDAMGEPITRTSWSWRKIEW